MLPRLLVSLCALVLLALAALPTSVDAAHVFDAYRLVQYDRGSRTLGSRRTAINMQAVSQTGAEAATAAAVTEWDVEEADEEVTKAATQDLARKVLVVRIAALSPAKLRSFAARGVGGLLIVLPRDLTTIAPAELARFKSLERFLATRSWDAAVYFAFEDEYLGDMVANLEFTLDAGSSTVAPTSSAQDKYQVQVTTPDAAPLTGATVSNFHGWQHAAASSTGDSDSLPTIALVANYDSMGAVPGLATGLDQNGSGTIALLELARIFHQLYADFRTHGSYNLLFILTGLDRVNYVSTKNWLRNIDSRVLEGIEFALCLERIASAPPAGTTAETAPLYLHVSRLPKTPELKALYGRFETTASEQSIPLEIVHRKINISEPTVFWQHEQFSRKRIVAATLSSSRDPSTLFAEGGESIFDGRHTIDLDVLSRNIGFIAEAVSKQIYGLPRPTPPGVTQSPVQVVPNAANKHVLAAYMDLFAATPRVTPLIAEPKNHALLKAFEAHFARFTLDFKKQAFGLEQLGAATGQLKMYADKEGGIASHPAGPRLGVVEMQAFQVKPFLFDVALAGAIAFYLLIVYIACKQPSNVGDVIAILIGR